MQSFDFVRAADGLAAVAAGAQSHTAQQGASVRFLAGGTTLVDLMKLGVEHPDRVVTVLWFDRAHIAGRAAVWALPGHSASA